jgi:hypothetical protein
MVLLVCILKDYRAVEDLLLAFVEEGVTGGTVLDARGMGQILGTEVPIFAAMRGLFPGSAMNSHVVFAAMPQAKGDRCLALIEHRFGPLSTPGSGIAFTLPLGQVVGLKPEIR